MLTLLITAQLLGREPKLDVAALGFNLVNETSSGFRKHLGDRMNRCELKPRWGEVGVWNSFEPSTPSEIGTSIVRVPITPPAESREGGVTADWRLERLDNGNRLQLAPLNAWARRIQGVERRRYPTALDRCLDDDSFTPTPPGTMPAAGPG